MDSSFPWSPTARRRVLSGNPARSGLSHRRQWPDIAASASPCHHHMAAGWEVCGCGKASNSEVQQCNGCGTLVRTPSSLAGIALSRVQNGRATSFGSVRDASDPPSCPGRGVSGRAPDVASRGPNSAKLQERECLGVLCNIIAAPAPRASMDRVRSAALPSLGSGSALGGNECETDAMCRSSASRSHGGPSHELWLNRLRCEAARGDGPRLYLPPCM